MSEATTTTAPRRIRSTSDRDLAARHDAEPFEFDGRRSEIITPAMEAHGWRFAPRVECIPSRYLVLLGPKGGQWREWRGIAADWDDAIAKAEAANPDWEAHTAGLDVENPRPEQNPILAYLREAMGRYPGLVLAAVAEEQLYSIREARMFGAQATYGFDATPDDIEGAYAVLKHIVGVYG